MSETIKMHLHSKDGIGMVVNTKGGGSSKVIKQIYIGDTEPTDPEILIWIDTSGDTPITDIQLITSDNLEFITANNEKFILKEV